MKPTLLLKPGAYALRMIARSMRNHLPQDADNWLPVAVIVTGIVLIVGLAVNASSFPSAYVLDVAPSADRPPIATEVGAAAGPVGGKPEPKDDGQGVNPAKAWLLTLINGGRRPFGFGFFK
jgi:hypothetical protein